MLIYRAKGLAAADAERLADKIMADREVALDTLRPLGTGQPNQDDLGSPWGPRSPACSPSPSARSSSVIPYLAGSGTAALLTAIILAVAALLGVGAEHRRTGTAAAV